MTADAGSDQTAQANERVVLDGSASTGVNARYAWTQRTGPPVNLIAPNEEQARFEAPAYADDTLLTFELVERVRQGPTTLDHTTVTVRAATPLDQQPIATPLAQLPRTSLLIEQYSRRPALSGLTNGLIAIVQERIVDVLLRVERGLNPLESEGILLDWIGARLHLPRPYVTAADAEYFGFEGTQHDAGQPFGQAPFYTPESGIEQVEPVADGIYRQAPVGAARRLRGGANQETIERVLDILFGAGQAYLDESDLNDPVLRVYVQTGNQTLYNLVSGRLFEAVIPRPAGTPLRMTTLDNPIV